MNRCHVKETVQALHPADIRTFFEGINLLQVLEARQITCSICGDVITTDNFRAVTKKNGKLRFACDKQACLEALAIVEF